jgi:hypothetical protein
MFKRPALKRSILSVWCRLNSCKAVVSRKSCQSHPSFGGKVMCRVDEGRSVNRDQLQTMGVSSSGASSKSCTHRNPITLKAYPGHAGYVELCAEESSWMPDPTHSPWFMVLHNIRIDPCCCGGWVKNISSPTFHDFPLIPCVPTRIYQR